MTYELFREITLPAKLQKLVFDKNGSSHDLERLEIQELVDRYEIQDWPPADDTTQYDSYMLQARKRQELYDSGRLRSVWTQALGKLPEVLVFRLSSWDFSAAHEFGHGAPELGGPHSHRHKEHPEAKCRTLQEPVGEAMLGAAFAAMADARSNVQKLDLHCVTDGTFSWADDGTLDSLNLSRLHTLLFKPCGAEIGEEFDWSEQKVNEVEQRCGLAVTQLLKKCATTIKHLEILSGLSGSPIFFPLDDVVSLPNLQWYESPATLRFSNFARFISEAKTLKEVHFDGNHGDDDSGTWRQVW